MAGQWIDFAALKRQVGLRDVLDHYGFLEGLTEKKTNVFVGACPIHQGSGKASFHADLAKNIWNCFSVCKGGGNTLDLVMRVEGCDVREAGEKIAEWFGLSFERNGRLQESAKVSGKPAGSPPVAAHDDQRVEAINPPLERPLRNLNGEHPYLAARGLDPHTIAHFGIGFCSVGLMRGRIAIPIHNERGELVAYAGRAIDDERSQEEGKYKLPRGFSKSHVVFNLHRANEHGKAKGLVVVEGFFGAMKVHEAGFPNVVALMGSTLSEQQENLLVNATDRLALMFDGDEAGTACLGEICRRLGRRLYLKEVHLEVGEQPDSVAEARLRQLLGG